MVDLITLWYVFAVIAAVMFILFMAVVGFSFWTSFVWKEFMKMDDDNLEKKEKEIYYDD